MSLGVQGATIPAIVGLGALVRRVEWRSLTQEGVAGTPINLTGTTEGLGALSAQVWRNLGAASPTLFYADARMAWDMATAAGVGGGRGLAFRPWVNTAQSLGFAAVFPPTAGTPPLGNIGRQPSVLLTCWMRKKAAGDATHARRGVGFGNNTATAPSAVVPRCGLIGDGALGFRFGSVHAPDGLAAGETGAAGIDAGAIQPAELVNPGASWFHVGVKLIPPKPNGSDPGKWVAYLNGRRIKTFDTAANLPRGNVGINGSGRDYSGVEATVYAFGDAAALVGPALWDVRVTIADEWDVPDNLV